MNRKSIPELETSYSRAVRMAGGVSRYVPLKTPRHGAHQTSHAAEWELDLELLSKAVTPKTRAIVRGLSQFFFLVHHGSC